MSHAVVTLIALAIAAPVAWIMIWHLQRPTRPPVATLPICDAPIALKAGTRLEIDGQVFVLTEAAARDARELKVMPILPLAKEQ